MGKVVKAYSLTYTHTHARADISVLDYLSSLYVSLRLRWLPAWRALFRPAAGGGTQRSGAETR